MIKLEKNSTVFNHARGVDKMTNDHRTVFHNIFKGVGSLNNTVLSDNDENSRIVDPRQGKQYGTMNSLRNRTTQQQESMKNKMDELVRFIKAIKQDF